MIPYRNKNLHKLHTQSISIYVQRKKSVQEPR